MKQFFTYGLAIALSIFSFNSTAQLVDGNAYMKGDYVEIAISDRGKEGAEAIDDTTYHFRGGALAIPWGFVANPQMDGWVDYNGDFFTPGTPECGFGLTYTLMGEEYSYSNNYNVFEIPGSIIDFTETVDSVSVTWEGQVDSLQISLRYDLKKDELLYTTTVSLNNLGSETFTDVYYYHNFDPDNNQPIGGTFTTINTIESQSEMADDSVIVSAKQYLPWLSEVILLADGADWKGAYGGFSNRNGNYIWNGIMGLTTTEGDSLMADQAIALAHKTESIAPGKTTATVFSFGTAFSRDVYGTGGGDGDDGDDDDDGDDGSHDDDSNVGIDSNIEMAFEIYPNPTQIGQITVSTTGQFVFTLTDTQGRLVLTGAGNDQTLIDLQNLEAGIYYIQIKQDDKMALQQIIVQ